ncbi:DAK2 domain protein [Sporomusa ovata DSM 2662]|uniref:Dihydroxyacetone kinase family protein n=1 Tax=Sporomusa ovata TaxID=2378 RepID=A0A0U1KVC1_9FIRM|nr:DAK2 domain-containing protein [Sporomusa ovata]CQR71079.1 Dihydroxyacetone kinase family protein [Sporomusa ovata]
MQPRGEVIDGKDFRRMITGAYSAFMRKHEYINGLNVFPVPDGDTGTNMLLTLGAVAKAVTEAPDEGIGSLARRGADSAIMGARGNSGVILSQLLRGIARGLSGKDTATSAEVGKAFQYGVLYAYRAVARPVEGTILTVAKGIAKGTYRAVRDHATFSDILAAAIHAGGEELRRTPELLPALKEAGVVDAGGQGLIVFLTGCLEGLEGTFCGPEADFGRTLTVPGITADITIAHPYCTEFIVKRFAASLVEVKRQLEQMGESLVLAPGEDILKVHMHTAHPGAVLESAIAWGTLHDIKIDNMADQHRQAIDMGEVLSAVPAAPAQARDKLAIISVVAGEGMSAIMRQLGANIIISGGQTMNPPVEEFITAVHNGLAEQYIILPNNKNIVLAAVQAKKLLGEQVAIVPTTTIPQGFAAILAFDPDSPFEANIRRMTDAKEAVRSGSLTMAVRDSAMDGQNVPEGSYIGVIDGSVVVWADNIAGALRQLILYLVEADSSVVSLYYGVELVGTEAQRLAEELGKELEGIEVQVYFGGQPHYQFIVSVE